jgi:hypothetical protein
MKKLTPDGTSLRFKQPAGSPKTKETLKKKRKKNPIEHQDNQRPKNGTLKSEGPVFSWPFVVAGYATPPEFSKDIVEGTPFG